MRGSGGVVARWDGGEQGGGQGAQTPGGQDGEEGGRRVGSSQVGRVGRREGDRPLQATRHMHPHALQAGWGVHGRAGPGMPAAWLAKPAASTQLPPAGHVGACGHACRPPAPAAAAAAGGPGSSRGPVAVGLRAGGAAPASPGSSYRSPASRQALACAARPANCTVRLSPPSPAICASGSTCSDRHGPQSAIGTQMIDARLMWGPRSLLSGGWSGRCALQALLPSLSCHRSKTALQKVRLNRNCNLGRSAGPTAGPAQRLNSSSPRGWLPTSGWYLHICKHPST